MCVCVFVCLCVCVCETEDQITSAESLRLTPMFGLQVSVIQCTEMDPVRESTLGFGVNISQINVYDVNMC